MLLNRRAVGGGEPLDDEIHDWVLILRGERKMTFAFPDYDSDPPTEFLESLLGDPRLGFEPRIEAAAKVEELHTRVGQRGQIIERLCFRHVAAKNGILAVDATDFARVRDGPSVGFPSRSACAFHDRLRGKALVD
jgi:hypothetical protein